MASPGLDLSAFWQSFLVGKYAATFFDKRLTREERVGAQMELESVILQHGPLMLRHVQASFNVQDAKSAGLIPFQQWFVSFVSTLDEDWLKEVNLATVVKLWFLLESTEFCRTTTELIVRVEWASDPNAMNAPNSELVGIFWKTQPDPFGPMTKRAQLILDNLFLRARLTPFALVRTPGGSLARYCLRIARFCFTKPHTRLTESQIDHIVKLAGELSLELRDYLRLVLTDVS